MDILVAIQGIFPILVGPAIPFDEVLYWLQFSYTAYRTGSYMAPASKVLVQSVVMEGGEIFLAFYWHLRKLYLGLYSSSTLGPGPDYTVYLTGSAPE